jgi:membrane dipeptidase
MEGGHAIENSLGALRAYYELGARYMTLAHGVTLPWVDSATDAPRSGGLSAFGREVVREMNRLGMLVDLSHVTPEAMEDALDTSEAPVIFSHSSARALVDHPRNVPDAVLRRMASNGGVVMVNFIPGFVSEPVRAWEHDLEVAMKRAGAAWGDAAFKKLEAEHVATRGPSPKATLREVADHVEHVARVAGHDHVGIGADYWGGEMPVGLEDVSRFPELFAELVRRGWSDADLRKLAGENFLRAFARAEVVSRRLRKERPASTATLEALDGGR